MALAALGGILGGSATGAAATTAATTAAQAAAAAQAARLAQAAKATQAAKFTQGAQGLAAQYGGNFSGPQGAVNPTPGGASVSGTSQVGPDFWSKFEASQGRPLGGGQVGPQASNDMMDKVKAGAQNFGNAAQDGVGNIDQRLSGMFAPSRATNQWSPNENPGIAGMMRQLRWSFGGGYGGIGGGRR